MVLTYGSICSPYTWVVFLLTLAALGRFLFDTLFRFMFRIPSLGAFGTLLSGDEVCSVEDPGPSGVGLSHNLRLMTGSGQLGG